MVIASEFRDGKTRLARIQNKRRTTEPADKEKLSLRRGRAGNDPGAQGSRDGEDRPTLHRREDREE